MMELILNSVWLVIAVGSAAAVVRRTRDARTLIALTILLALLFPIISTSDDLANIAVNTELFAILLRTLVFFVGLVALGRLRFEHEGASSLATVPIGDPRSPPVR